MPGMWPQGCRALPLLSLPWGFQVTVLLSGPSRTCLGLIDKRPLGIPLGLPFSLSPVTQGGSRLITYLENVFTVAFENLLCN